MKEITLLGFLILILIVPSVSLSFSEETKIFIDNNFYKKTDIISIWGSAPGSPQNLVFVTIKDSDNETMWTEKIRVDEKGNFSTLIIAGINDWPNSGTYEIVLESGSMISVSYTHLTLPTKA